MIRWASNVVYPVRSRRTKWPADDFERTARLFVAWHALRWLGYIIFSPGLILAGAIVLLHFAFEKLADLVGALIDVAGESWWWRMVRRAHRRFNEANQANGKRYGWSDKND